MKPTSLVAGVSALSGAVAFAREATPDDWMNVVSTKSRGDVVQHLVVSALLRWPLSRTVLPEAIHEQTRQGGLPAIC